MLPPRGISASKIVLFRDDDRVIFVVVVVVTEEVATAAAADDDDDDAVFLIEIEIEQGVDFSSKHGHFILGLFWYFFE